MTEKKTAARIRTRNLRIKKQWLFPLDQEVGKLQNHKNQVQELNQHGLSQKLISLCPRTPNQHHIVADEKYF